MPGQTDWLHHIQPVLYAAEFPYELEKQCRDKDVARTCRMKPHGSGALMHKNISNNAERYMGLTTALKCFTETNMQ